MLKQNFVQRVIAALKGGDEAKMSRFSTKLSRFIEKQIAMRTDSIATLKDKMIDAEEALQEAVVNVDLSSVNSTEGQESYCSIYFKRISDLRKASESLAKQITVLEEEIANIQATSAVIFAETEVAE